MHSNDQAQVRAGLVNYIGAMLSASKFENDKAIKHSVVAILLEEAVKLCKDKDGYFDMYVSKPALRLTSSIAKQRCDLMDNLPSKTPEIQEQIEAYGIIKSELNKILENTKL